MNNLKQLVFTATKDGKEVEFLVTAPNLEQQRGAQKEYNRAFSDAIQSGALLRAKLDDFMKNQDLWGDDKQTEFTRLNKEIYHRVSVLTKGGIPLKEARKMALELKSLRADKNDLLADRMQLDTHTAEGQADNVRFNYWVSVCVVYNDSKKPVFSSLEDYLSKSNEDYASTAAEKLALIVYNVNEDYESSLEENKFLKEFGFTDEEGRLVNEHKQYITEDGIVIDKDGYLLNEDNERVDSEGNLLDENGKIKATRSPFLDDNGKEVLAETKVVDVAEEPQEEPVNHDEPLEISEQTR